MIDLDLWVIRPKKFSLRVLNVAVLTSLLLPFQASLAADVTDSDDEVDSIQLPGITVWGSNRTEQTTAYIPSKTTIASKLPVELKDIPQSVSVVTRQRIEDQNLTSLEDALRTVTGVTVIPNDSSQSQYRARGYSLNAAIDGIPVVSGLSGAEQFDLAVYDRVEVLRGAAGLLSGSGDPGGTVNVVTKKPLSKFAVSGAVSGGSWDNYRGEIDITGPLNADKSLRGRFVGVAQDKDFFYDKTHQRKFVGYGVLEYDLTDQTTLSLTHSAQKNDTDASYYGLPANKVTGALLDIDRSVNPTPNWANSGSTTNESVFAIEHRLANGWTATAKARYLKREFDYIDTYAWSGVDPETWTLEYARAWDENYQYKRKALDFYVGGPFQLFDREHNFLIGYNYDYYTVDNTWGSTTDRYPNVSLFNPEAIAKPSIPHTSGAADKTVQSGLYTQARLKVIDPLTLVLGGRVSDYKTSSRAIAPSALTDWETGTKETGEFTPYAGIVYEINPKISVYGSYSDIFIPQSVKTFSGETLKPRVGEQFEIGVKGAFFEDKLNASIAAFKLNDVNRSFRDPDRPNETVYIAAGEVESKGIEAEISGSPLPNWNLTAGYTYFTNKFLTHASLEGKPISTAEPENSFKLWSHYGITDGTLAGLKLGVGVNAVSDYAGSRGTQLDRKQGGYTLIGAAASYPVNKNLTIALNAENLTDKKYYASTGGTNTYNIYGSPRNFTLSLRFKY